MSELVALLTIQRHDNTLDQLRYKHEHLPERAAIAEIDAELETLASARAATEASRDDLRSRQRSIETDAADIEAKADSLTTKLYDGSVTSPKEATALGDEISGLKERQSNFETQAIELLLEIEPLDEQLVQAEAARGEFEAKRGEHQALLDSNASALEAEIADLVAERATAADAVDPDNLELYRKMRITYGPDAVVEFDPAHNGGCPVAMSAVELDRWKHLPPGTLEPCVDCGRLVAKLT